ncbi:MAG TPA: hypothetical protein DCS13_01550 [Candidatus Margulisbacteria bacterium]|nr:MAG: hypothetical protein A2X43_01455 [Candidatus Margulisbacteria bacterium GWD2_39_127]HAR62127.1 hypothetical protein [Candidatus Margulisiibacteriota bacterium]
MSKISEDFIFHYTKKEALLSILKTGFVWGKTKEPIPYSKDAKGVVLSGQTTYMICFCDLPIDLATRHRGTYGDYAIGLRKDWAYRRQISPVKYVHKNTRLISNMKQYPDLTYRLSKAKGNVDQFLQGLYATWQEKDELDGECITKISKKEKKLGNLLAKMIEYISFDIIPFIRDLDCYEEREWRAVLETRDMGLPEDNLIFSFSDIEIILVPQEEDKQIFFHQIRDTERKLADGKYSNHISDDEIIRKIKTYEEVDSHINPGV